MFNSKVNHFLPDSGWIDSHSHCESFLKSDAAHLGRDYGWWVVLEWLLKALLCSTWASTSTCNLFIGVFHCFVYFWFSSVKQTYLAKWTIPSILLNILQSTCGTYKLRNETADQEIIIQPASHMKLLITTISSQGDNITILWSSLSNTCFCLFSIFAFVTLHIYSLLLSSFKGTRITVTKVVERHFLKITVILNFKKT